MFTFYKDYVTDFNGSSSVLSKENTLEFLWKEMTRVSRELEDKQNYDLYITITDDTRNKRWVGKLDIKFPNRQYGAKAV